MSKEPIGTAEGFGSNDFKLFNRLTEKKLGGTMCDEIDEPVGIGCGSYRMDMALTEAFPRGYMHEIFANEGAGKTTLALEICGAHQQHANKMPIGPAGYLDVEGSLNKSLVRSIETLNTEMQDADGNPLWIYKEGLLKDKDDEDDIRILSGEECLQYAEIFLSTFKNAVLVVDSIDSLQPEAILKGKDIGEPTIGKLAKLMSDACRRLKSICKKNNNALIWINQVRENPGQIFGDPEVTPGGKAVKFYSCQRVKLVKNAGKANFDIDSDGNVLGHLVKCKVVKNKMPTTNYEPTFWLKYGSGIDRAKEITELALELCIVENEKSSYFFNRGTDKEVKVVGVQKAKDYIANNKNVMDELAAKIKEFMQS